MAATDRPSFIELSLESLQRRMVTLERKTDSEPEHGGGSSGGSGGFVDLVKRVESLEKSLQETREKVVKIEVTVDSIKQHGASKEDIQKVFTAIEANGTKIEAMGRTMIQWAIGTGLTAAALAFTAAKLIHP